MTRQFHEGIKVLVVDDVSDVRIVLEFFLSHHGAEVLAADNAIDGIEIALQQKPSLILMDLQLPDMDGYVAVRSLRGRGFLGPVIAMTGGAPSELRNISRLAGFTDLIGKPIDLVFLRGMMDRHLSDAAGSLIIAS